MYYFNNKEYTKKGFINLLIQRGQVKDYEKMNSRFKRETPASELPALRVTPAGYVYAVINMKEIKTKAIKYYGYLQGYKVYINGKKYPKKYGHFYTSLKEEEAIKDAMKEVLK